MLQKPKILLRYGRVNQPVRVPTIDLLVDNNTTTLVADTASGVSSLSVKNIQGFDKNQILFIGVKGNQGAEIIKTSTVTSPSAGVITLAAATSFPHSYSSQVALINYDQVEISYTTTSSVGVKSVLTTLTVTADDETIYYDTNTTGYYFARFKNSITNSYSPYSDAAPVDGYTILSARSIIDKSLGKLHKNTSAVFSDEYAFQNIDDCQTEVLRGRKRWSFMQKFDQSLGSLTTGQWKISLPTDIDDNNTNKSIYNFKIGTGTNITWVDKEKWNEIIQGVAHTTLSVSIIIGASTITLTDASNFNQAGGTVFIAGNYYTYTSVSGNVLTLLAVSTTTNTSGQDVFQGATVGMPQFWTTFGGYIYFYPILSPTQNGNVGYMDYYSKQISIQNDTDTIVLPDPTLVESYLCWAFLVRQNNGEDTDSSLAWYNKFLDRVRLLNQKESLNRTFKLKPTLNRFDMSGDDPKSIRLGNFLQ